MTGSPTPAPGHWHVRLSRALGAADWCPAARFVTREGLPLCSGHSCFLFFVAQAGFVSWRGGAPGHQNCLPSTTTTSAGTRTARTRRVSSRTPNQTMIPSSVRVISASTPRTANTAASRMAAMTPPPGVRDRGFFPRGSAPRLRRKPASAPEDRPLTRLRSCAPGRIPRSTRVLIRGASAASRSPTPRASR
jgi:hypothetical protein